MKPQVRKPLEFIAVFLGVFFLAAIVLYVVDFVPEQVAPSQAAERTSIAPITAAPIAHASTGDVAEPMRIEIPAVGVDTPVENPTATTTDTLDAALLKGATHYPGSALLGENATMYLFGHQSYLPVVHNKAYKAFNGLQNLKAGDEIIVSSDTNDYHYQVTSVELVNADTASVDLESGATKLVLTTCDVFGEKAERWVVKADFVSETSKGNN